MDLIYKVWFYMENVKYGDRAALFLTLFYIYKN